jgi:hypothetical protein
MKREDDQALPNGSFSDWFFPGIFIVAGLAIILFGLQGARRDYESTNWPKADGSIRSSIVRRSTNKNGVSYQANVLFDYVVSGVAYSGSQVSFSQFGLGSSNHAQSIVDRYPKGARVKVSYAPGDPALSVLETGLSIADSFLPLGGAAFLIAGYYLGPSRKWKPTAARPSVVRTRLI